MVPRAAAAPAAAGYESATAAASRQREGHVGEEKESGKKGFVEKVFRQAARMSLLQAAVDGDSAAFESTLHDAREKCATIIIDKR